MKNILKLIPSALLAFSVGAQAAVTITIQEVGKDVVVRGSGYVDIDTDYPFELGIDSSVDVLDPSDYAIQVGSSSVALNYFLFQPHPSEPDADESFGTGPQIQQPAGNITQPFRFSLYKEEAGLMIGVPENYISGSNLSFSTTYANATLESLGIDLGSSYWSWGGDTDGQFVYLNVIPRATAPTAPTSVPTLGAFGLMGLAGVIGAAGVAMNRRRKQ